jgi:hypothetical protein
MSSYFNILSMFSIDGFDILSLKNIASKRNLINKMNTEKPGSQISKESKINIIKKF